MALKPGTTQIIKDTFDPCTQNRLAAFMSLWSSLRDEKLIAEELCDILLWILCLIQLCATYNPLVKDTVKQKAFLAQIIRMSSSNKLRQKVFVLYKTLNIDCLWGREVEDQVVNYSWIPIKDATNELTETFLYNLPEALNQLESDTLKASIKSLEAARIETLDTKNIEDLMEKVQSSEVVWSDVRSIYEPTNGAGYGSHTNSFNQQKPCPNGSFSKHLRTLKDLLSRCEELKTKSQPESSRKDDVKPDAGFECGGHSVRPKIQNSTHASSKVTGGSLACASGYAVVHCIYCSIDFPTLDYYINHKNSMEHSEKLVQFNDRLREEEDKTRPRRGSNVRRNSGHNSSSDID
uniref:C2H2-type domain-containing protein n=1 Tax=Mesocestoides corti TaxID=53468 RepID=A0A5K3ENS0_MESCO